MGASLLEQLKQVEDLRTIDGRRHPLWLVSVFVIMGTMNGCVGYRGCGDFVKRHRRVSIERFGTIEVFDDLNGIDPEWTGIKSCNLGRKIWNKKGEKIS